MIVLYILAGLLALTVILLCIPVIAEAKYEDELLLNIKYLFISFQLVPRCRKKTEGKLKRFFGRLWRRYFARPCKKTGAWLAKFFNSVRKTVKKAFRRIKARLGIHKKSKKTKEPEKKQKEKSAFSQLYEERGFGGMISILWRVVSLAAGSFAKILRGVIVKQFDLAVTVRDSDAAAAAVSYGKWCTVLYPALAMALGATRRYNKNIDISVDFSGGETSAEAKLKLVVFPISVLIHALGALLRLLFLEISDAVRKNMADAASSASINIKQGGAI